MNIVTIFSNTNVKGKHDATGAFIPYEQKFSKLHGVPVNNRTGINCVNLSRNKRRGLVFDAILSAGRSEKIDAIAFFCHGWPSGLQVGLNCSELPGFTELLKSTCARDVKIILYACLAAENDVRDSERRRLGPATDGGFADTLRDLMSAKGLTDGHVDAHKTAGNALWNPFVVRFPCQIRPEHAYPELYTGGAWLVEPGSEYWHKWCAHNDLDLRYPFMSQSEIFAELARG